MHCPVVSLKYMYRASINSARVRGKRDLFKSVHLLVKWRHCFAKVRTKMRAGFKNLTYLSVRSLWMVLALSNRQSSRPEAFCQKGVLRNFAKFTGKHVFQSLFFNKVAGLRSATVLKKTLWHRCFPVNFVKILRTPFYIEHLRWLLLCIATS